MDVGDQSGVSADFVVIGALRVQSLNCWSRLDLDNPNMVLQLNLKLEVAVPLKSSIISGCCFRF